MLRAEFSAEMREIMKKKFTAVLLLLTMLLGLAGCGGTVDMPAEVTIDGYTIVLGETTMQELQDQGYEVFFSSSQDTARDTDKYITFVYVVKKTSKQQFSVTVGVPWEKGKNINKEKKLSATEGIIKSITMRKDSLTDVEVLYNDVNLQDLTFEYGESEWGAKKQDSSTLSYQTKTKNGYVTLKAENTFKEEFYSLKVELHMRGFEAMQK